MSDIDPPEGPCAICGKSVDDCICPECPVCHVNGRPECYAEHGLTLTDEQRRGQQELAEQRRHDAEADALAEQQMYEDMK